MWLCDFSVIFLILFCGKISKFWDHQPLLLWDILKTYSIIKYLIHICDVHIDMWVFSLRVIHFYFSGNTRVSSEISNPFRGVGYWGKESITHCLVYLWSEWAVRTELKHSLSKSLVVDRIPKHEATYRILK